MCIRDRFSAPLPNTKSYVFYYNTRTSTARALETERHVFMEHTNWLQEAVERYFLDTHGLDERYRRATNRASSWNWDTPGDGGTINRDGPALTVLSPVTNFDTQGYPDEFLAQFLARCPNTFSSGTTEGFYGRIGFLDLAQVRERDGGAEYGQHDRPRAAFMSLSRRNQGDTSLGGEEFYTRIPLGAAAVLNPAGGPGTNAVRLTGTSFFTKNISSYDRTSIRLGVDMLQIERTSKPGSPKELYRIFIIDDSTTVRMLNRKGTSSVAFDPDEPALVTWLQPQFEAGPDKLGYYSRGYIGEGSTGQWYCTEFFACSTYRNRGSYGDSQENYAVMWGGHNDTTGEMERNGVLKGNGGIECFDIQANLHSSLTRVVSAAAFNAYTINLDPNPDAPQGSWNDGVVHLFCDNTVKAVMTVSVFWNSDYTPKPGHRFTFIITVTDPASTVTLAFNDFVGTKDITWLFNDIDKTQAIPQGVAGTWKFEGVMAYETYPNDFYMMMTVTEYLA